MILQTFSDGLSVAHPRMLVPAHGDHLRDYLVLITHTPARPPPLPGTVLGQANEVLQWLTDSFDEYAGKTPLFRCFSAFDSR